MRSAKYTPHDLRPSAITSHGPCNLSTLFTLHGRTDGFAQRGYDSDLLIGGLNSPRFTV